MKRRDQLTISGNKEKSQRRGAMTMARLRTTCFVFGTAVLVQLLAIHAFATLRTRTESSLGQASWGYGK